MSPEKRMPPSAISGTPWPCSTRAHSRMAVSCGTPMPATMRVVQIEPGPMPTLTASAPASRELERALGRGDVAGDDVDLEAALQLLDGVAPRSRVWPCAVSTTSTSTPALTRPSERS